MKYISRTSALIVFAITLIHSGVYAQIEVSRSVFGSGATVLSNRKYRIEGTIGQPAIGVMRSSSYINYVGFWLPKATTGRIIIHAPDAGVPWIVGTTQTVRWDSSEVIGNVNIMLSLDGGSTFPVSLASNTPNDGSETIAVPNNPSTTCRVRVESVSDPDIFGDSPSNFTIQLPSAEGEIKLEVAASQLIGAEFWFDIKVYSVQDLFGVSFNLDYTQTTYIDVVGIPTPGDFLGSDVIFLPTVDDASGKINIGISRKAGQGGVSGSGVVARIKFMSLTSTPSETHVLFSLHEVTANNPSGNLINLTPTDATTNISGNMSDIIVWPGDTNNDGVANQADILPLGVHWGRTGPRRLNASMSWTAQPCSPWSPIAATYADVNGDSVINQADILPIGLNWGRTHSSASFVKQSSAKIQSSQSATLKPETNPVQAPGQEFFIRIRASEMTDLFGLSFELLYDKPALLQILAVEPDSMLGSDPIFLANVDDANGKVGAGITRKAGQPGVNGAGFVVRIKTIITAQAQSGEVIQLSLQNVAALDAAGQPIVMTLQSSTITVMTTTAAASRRDALTITDYRLHQNHPNPFNPGTVIEYEIPHAGQVVVKVYNLVGQEVRTLVNTAQQPGSYQINWDGRNELRQVMPSGVYLYRIQAESFVETRRMTLLR